MLNGPYCPTCWHMREEHVYDAATARRPCAVHSCRCTHFDPSVLRARCLETLLWLSIAVCAAICFSKCEHDPHSVPTVARGCHA